MRSHRAFGAWSLLFRFSSANAMADAPIATLPLPCSNGGVGSSIQGSLAVDVNQTVFAFRSESVIRIIRKLDAAAELARALEKCLPAVVGLTDREEAERTALSALANWEEACR